MVPPQEEKNEMEISFEGVCLVYVRRKQDPMKPGDENREVWEIYKNEVFFDPAPLLLMGSNQPNTTKEGRSKL